MRLVVSKPRLHIFVCLNQRDSSAKMPSCGRERGSLIAEGLRSWLAERGLWNEVWLTTTACLGFCHVEGVTLAIYPQKAEGWLFHRITPLDIPAILEHLEHILASPFGSLLNGEASS